jgi:hypothetical protein
VFGRVESGLELVDLGSEDGDAELWQKCFRSPEIVCFDLENELDQPRMLFTNLLKWGMRKFIASRKICAMRTSESALVT